MSVEQENSHEPGNPGMSELYDILETLKHPVSILGKDGSLVYGNSTFRHFFKSGDREISLDWEHPFYPEYRKRIAQAYTGAIKGADKQCFAIMNSPEGKQLPVEIYLFPMYQGNEVKSILSLMKIVDDRLLSFDRSTLSLISDENFQYDNQHFEFSPMPIMRIDENREVTRCSHSFEGFIGYTCAEIIEKKLITFKSIFIYDYERVNKALSRIISGEISFKRLGEIKILAKDNSEKIVNLAIYPIIQKNEISSFEIIMEDITRIKELKEKVNLMNRFQVLGDITKGFLHSLNNSINVIMSKTQLLLQITEKESVVEGINLIEKSATEIVEQIRRVQNFIGDRREVKEESIDDLVQIIEDAIEFSKMQFKVEDRENRRSIKITRQYFTSANVKSDSRLLTEIIISIILKVATFISKKGTLSIHLKENHDLYLSVTTEKDTELVTPSPSAFTVNIFSRIDVRQTAEKLNIKIIEEESADSYTLKAVFPPRIIADKQYKEIDSPLFKIRDLDIIVVEDEKALQEILYELFDTMGNRVFICENGQEAIAEFKKKHYDIVMTDYGLEGMTGIELSARVKEINEDTTTVLLSGWMLNDVNAYKNVVDLFLPKPFKLDNLIKKISQVLEKKK